MQARDLTSGGLRALVRTTVPPAPPILPPTSTMLASNVCHPRRLVLLAEHADLPRRDVVEGPRLLGVRRTSAHRIPPRKIRDQSAQIARSALVPPRLHIAQNCDETRLAVRRDAGQRVSQNLDNLHRSSPASPLPHASRVAWRGRPDQAALLESACLTVVVAITLRTPSSRYAMFACHALRRPRFVRVPGDLRRS